MTSIRTMLTGRPAVIAVLTVAAAGAVVASSGPVQAAAAGHSGTEYFTIAESTHTGQDVSGNQTFIAHGLFTGGGRDDASRDAYDVLHFGNGTSTVRHPQSAEKYTVHSNPKTCFTSIALTGTYTFVNGTGHYKGVTGHGSYRGEGQFIAPRGKNGACKNNALPTSAVFLVHASGPATMP